MKARELILKNCFSYQELLIMKNEYVKAIHNVYGKGVKVASDETFENYILVIADVVSTAFFAVTIIGFINVSIMLYLHGLTRGPFAMFIISMVVIMGVAILNSRARKIRIKTTLKLIKMRFKMFIFMITPP